MTLHIVILAAGLGKRMQSDLPKVMHPIGGQPMLSHVLRTATKLKPTQIHVVIGHGSEVVRAAFAAHEINWVVQDKQLGTGHAVMQVIPAIPDDAQVLVLAGDVPLVREATLQRLLQATPPQGLGVVTIELDDPKGLGRIVRSDGHEIVGIVEDKDATPEQQLIKEINTGIILANATNLKQWLPEISNENAQGEYYLPDIFKRAVSYATSITSVRADSASEVLGVNDRIQQAAVERIHQAKQAEELLRQGVTLFDPARLDIRGELSVGKDVEIDINVIIRGKVELADGCKIGPNCVLDNVQLGSNTVVLANSVLEDSRLGSACVIGPFARVRPGTQLHDNVKIGNFVEVKKSEIQSGSKVSHLSYIGDTQMGSNVNIGAGTITCNYDGHKKHQTIIEDEVFVGSNNSLVAPLTLERGATIGAGSTVTKTAAANKLTVARAKQVTLSEWKRK